MGPSEAGGHEIVFNHVRWNTPPGPIEKVQQAKLPHLEVEPDRGGPTALPLG